MAMRFGQYGDERILVPDAAQLNFTAAFSMSAWINLQVYPGATPRWATIMSKNDFPHMQYDLTNSAVSIAYQYAGVNYHELFDTSNISLNTWYHFVGTVDTSSTVMAIYRNGLLTNSSSGNSQALATTAVGLSIGSLNSSRYFSGFLADCRIYNRALNAQEVSTIYAATGHDGIWNGLVARYVLDEGWDGLASVGTTNSIIDSSIYRNDGSPFSDGAPY
jgi:hypothetical protein